MAGDQEAGLVFVRFLKAAHIPESLWETLLDKIDRGTVGCDDFIEVRIPRGCLPAVQVVRSL